MLGTLATVFGDQIRRVVKVSKIPTVVTEENVYQEGDPDVLSIVDEMIDHLALPGSGIDGIENLEELLTKAESGKACLLLVEHYSNMDLSIVSTLTRRLGGRGKDIGDSIIAIAGMKLNENNPIVAAFTGAYSKIVIYPSRSIQERQAQSRPSRTVLIKELQNTQLSSNFLIIISPLRVKTSTMSPSLTRISSAKPQGIINSPAFSIL